MGHLNDRAVVHDMRRCEYLARVVQEEARSTPNRMVPINKILDLYLGIVLGRKLTCTRTQLGNDIGQSSSDRVLRQSSQNVGRMHTRSWCPPCDGISFK